MKVSAAVLAAFALVAGATAAVTPGQYRLHNHPDGGILPPPYGLRLDELYDVTYGIGNDFYTFDFDAPGSNVLMDVTASTIHIYGNAFGGRDVGGTYAVEPATGMYTFDFLYDVGVALVPGDDDMWVNGSADNANTGYILTPLGHNFSLGDKNDTTGLSFRLGDEDNDLGHRGFAGISGWGWLTHNFQTTPHIDYSDWLFTAELVPAPSTALLAAGAFGFAARRRRK